MAWITLNNSRFKTKGRIRRFKVDALASVVRQSGRQRLDSLTKRQSLVFPAPTYGMGLRRIPTDRIDDPTMARRTWDSMADTRHEAGVTLPLLSQDSTEPTSSGDTLYSMRFNLKFKGDLWGFWDGLDHSGADGFVVARKYTGSSTSWTGGGVVATAAGSWIVPIWGTVVSNYMVVLVVNGDDHQFYRSTDGATWAAASTQPTANMLVNQTTQSERINAGVCMTVGSTVYAFLWDEDNDEIEAWQSTNQGDDFTAVSGAIVAPGGGPVGGAVYLDLNGDASPCFSARDGIYALDTSASTVQKLRDLLQDDNTGFGLTRWSNPVTGIDGLYCGTGDGDIAEYVYLGGRGAQSSVITKSVGLTGGDGIVAKKQGYVHAMEPSPLALFYLYGGAASSRNAWIGAFDGKGSLPMSKGAGHHFMAQDATANRIWDRLALSNADDGIMRLHYHVHPTLTVSTVAVDASSSATITAGTTVTFSHTTSIAANRYMLVFVAQDASAVVSITYDSVSMTPISSTPLFTGAVHITAFELIAPATGSNNVVVTIGASDAVITVITFTGVDQTKPKTTVQENSATSGTSNTIAVTTIAGGIAVGGVAHDVNEAHTPNTGDTEHKDLGVDTHRLSMNTQAAAALGTATTTIGASWTSSDDNVHIALCVLPATSTLGDTLFLAEPLATPDSGVTRSFANPAASGGGANTGFIERPETNMGMPRDQAAFIAIFVEARDLSGSASGEFINENYGVDGATPTTDIGNMLSGTLELNIAGGTNGAGVSGRSIQLREELDRAGTATQSPLLVATEVMYRKKIPSLQGWEVTIDVQGMNVPQQESVQDIIDALNTAENAVPLQAFLEFPSGATNYYVAVTMASYTYAPVDDPQEGDAETPETIEEIRLVLEEIV